MEDEEKRNYSYTINYIWGCSSVGRAPALQAGGQEFESPHLHHSKQKVLNTQKRLIQKDKPEEP